MSGWALGTIDDFWARAAAEVAVTKVRIRGGGNTPAPAPARRTRREPEPLNSFKAVVNEFAMVVWSREGSSCFLAVVVARGNGAMTACARRGDEAVGFDESQFVKLKS